MKHSLLIFVIIIFLRLSINAQEKSVEIKKLTVVDFSIADFIEVFEDSTQTLTIEKVSSPVFENRFHENKLAPKKLTESQEGVVWGRFKIKNLASRDREWYLTSNFSSYTLCQKIDSITFSTKFAGTAVPSDENTLKPRGSRDMTIFLKSGEEVQFFIRCKVNNHYTFPSVLKISLTDQKSAEIKKRKYRTYFAGFAGITVMMIVYVLALFVVFKEKTYLWLCIALASTVLYFLNFFGIASSIFTSQPLFTIFVTYALSIIYIPLMILGQFIFLNLFLEFKKYLGKWMILSYIHIFITIIWSPFFIMIGHYALGQQTSNILIMSVPLVVLFLIIRLVIKGNPLAKLMLISQGLFLVIVIIAQLILLEIIRSNDPQFTSRIILMAGYIIQSLLWSLAIIYKLVILRKEKEKAQTEVIHGLQAHEKLILEQNVTLELKVDERTKELVEKNTIISREKERSDELLLNILPAEIAEELKDTGASKAKSYDEVTVMFTDFKGFTQLSEKLSPKELVAEINECFSAFDHIMHKYGVEKIKTIGDAYMAAGGLPTANNTHPNDVVNAAIAVQQFMQEHKVVKEAAGKLFFEIRIGVHTGPVVAGIVGVKKFAYDIWGDTVNTASRMESSGEVGRVNISGTTYELVKDKFKCTHRGKVIAKGKGEIDMYFVETKI
ncbi:MAG: adenylate/guanylate cyclase domain-containing protein [Bacteroidia bacterium]